MHVYFIYIKIPSSGTDPEAPFGLVIPNQLRDEVMSSMFFKPTPI